MRILAHFMRIEMSVHIVDHSLTGDSNVKNKISLWYSYLTVWYLSKGNKIHMSKRDIYIIVLHEKTQQKRDKTYMVFLMGIIQNVVFGTRVVILTVAHMKWMKKWVQRSDYWTFSCAILEQTDWENHGHSASCCTITNMFNNIVKIAFFLWLNNVLLCIYHNFHLFISSWIKWFDYFLTFVYYAVVNWGM